MSGVPRRAVSTSLVADAHQEYTNMWRTWHASRRNIHLVYQELHKKYGPIVRVGPNVLDVDLPEIVKPAFNDIKSDWRKVRTHFFMRTIVTGV